MDSLDILWELMLSTSRQTKLNGGNCTSLSPPRYENDNGIARDSQPYLMSVLQDDKHSLF